MITQLFFYPDQLIYLKLILYKCKNINKSAFYNNRLIIEINSKIKIIMNKTLAFGKIILKLNVLNYTPHSIVSYFLEK